MQSQSITTTMNSEAKQLPPKPQRSPSEDCDSTAACSFSTESAGPLFLTPAHSPARQSRDDSPIRGSPSATPQSPNLFRKNAKGQKPKYFIPKHESQVLAIDAEMVGVGKFGLDSSIARVTIIDWWGSIIFDRYIKQTQKVTDYRTFVSGVTAEHLASATLSLRDCRKEVLQLLYGRILVGHGLKNDVNALGISHPWWLVRDTAHYKPFMQTRESYEYQTSPYSSSTTTTTTHETTESSSPPPLSEAQAATSSTQVSSQQQQQQHQQQQQKQLQSLNKNSNGLWPRKLKALAKESLGQDIQAAGTPHSPLEDALAAMGLYKTVRHEWESTMRYKVQKTRQAEQHRSMEYHRQSQRQRNHHIQLQYQQQQQWQQYYQNMQQQQIHLAAGQPQYQLQQPQLQVLQQPHFQHPVYHQ